MILRILWVAASLVPLGGAVTAGTTGTVTLPTAPSNLAAWSSSYSPGKACYAWDDANATVYVFHGNPVTVVSYNILAGTSQTWTGSTGWPAARQWFHQKDAVTKLDYGAGSMFIYVPTYKRLVLFGGFDGTNFFQDTWVMHPAQGQWTQTATSGMPSKRGWPGYTTDPQGVVYMYGGGPGNHLALNDLWTFTLSSATAGSWSAVTTTGSGPQRWQMGLGISGDNLFLFGGGCCSSSISAGMTFADLWRVGLTSKVWSQVGFTTGGGPAGRSMWTQAPFLAVHTATGTLYVGPGSANGAATVIQDFSSMTYSASTYFATTSQLDSTSACVAKASAVFIAQRQARAYFIQGSTIAYYQLAAATCSTAVTCPPGQSVVPFTLGNELNFQTCCRAITTTIVPTTTTSVTTTSTSSTVTTTVTTVTTSSSTVTTTSSTRTTSSSTVTTSSSTVTQSSTTTSVTTVTSSSSTETTTSSTRTTSSSTVTTSSSTVTQSSTTTSVTTVTTSSSTATTSSSTATTSSSTVTGSSSTVTTSSSTTSVSSTTTVTVTTTSSSGTTTVTVTATTATTSSSSSTTSVPTTMTVTLTTTTSSVTSTVTTSSTTSVTVTTTSTGSTVTATTTTSSTTTVTVTVTAVTATVTGTSTTSSSSSTLSTSTLSSTSTSSTPTTAAVSTVALATTAAAVETQATSTSTRSTGNSTETKVPAATSASSSSTSTGAATTALASSTPASSSTATEVQCMGAAAAVWKVPTALLLPGQEIQAFVTVQKACLDLSAVNVSLTDSSLQQVPVPRAAVILGHFDNSSGVSADLLAAASVPSFVGRRLFVFSVAAGVTQRGRSYRLQFQGSGAVPWTLLSAEFRTDTGPVNGRIFLSPSTGEAVITSFSVSTSWEAAPAVLPLSYCFFQRRANSSDPWTVLSAWSSRASQSLLFSAQRWEVGAQAKDSLGLQADAPVVSAPILVTASSLDASGALALLASSQATNNTHSLLNTLQVVAESAAAPVSKLGSHAVAGSILNSLASIGAQGGKDGAVQKAWILRNVVSAVQLNDTSATKATTVLMGAVSSLSSDSGLAPKEAQHFVGVISALASSPTVVAGDNRTQVLADLASGVASAMVQGLVSSTTECLAEGNATSVSTAAPGLVLSAGRVPMSKQGANLPGLPASSIPQSVMDLAKASAPGGRCGQVLGAASASWSSNPFGPLQVANSSSGRVAPVNPMGGVVSLTMMNGKGEKLPVANLSIPLPMVIPLRSASAAAAVDAKATRVSDYRDFELRLLQSAAAVPDCRWWDQSLNTWSTAGCRVMSLAANGGELRCSCTHLTDFGAFPGSGAIALGTSLDLLSLLAEGLLFATTCAKVHVFEAEGMRRLLATRWQVRASTISLWTLMGLVLLVMLCASAADAKNRCKDSAAESDLVDLVTREVPEDPANPRGLRGACAAVTGFCLRNRLWRTRLRLWTSKLVCASKLGLCQETQELLLDYETEAQGPLPAELQQQLRQVLGKPETWGQHFQQTLAEVQASVRRQCFVTRVVTIALALHPIHKATCGSLHYYHTVRALLLLTGLTGGIALNALLDAGDTVTYDSPDSCVTQQDSAKIAGAVLHGVGTALVPALLGLFFRFAGPRRQLGRTASRRSCGCFWAKMGLSLLLGVALVAFFLLYIALYLANVYPSMATWWILTGFVLCCVQYLVIIPLLMGLLLAPVFDWFPASGTPSEKAKDTVVIDLTLSGADSDAEQQWRGVVPAQKQKPQRIVEAPSLPGALPASEDET